MAFMTTKNHNSHHFRLIGVSTGKNSAKKQVQQNQCHPAANAAKPVIPTLVLREILGHQALVCAHVNSRQQLTRRTWSFSRSCSSCACFTCSAIFDPMSLPS
eukprot:3324558-Amphidinium_carterae.1